MEDQRLLCFREVSLEVQVGGLRDHPPTRLLAMHIEHVMHMTEDAVRTNPLHKASLIVCWGLTVHVVPDRTFFVFG
jgi:hypothetical protein